MQNVLNFIVISLIAIIFPIYRDLIIFFYKWNYIYIFFADNRQFEQIEIYRAENIQLTLHNEKIKQENILLSQGGSVTSGSAISAPITTPTSHVVQVIYIFPILLI